MKTIHLEIDENQFKKMYEQHIIMCDDVKEIKEALLGNQYRKTGVIKQLEALEETFLAHDQEDKDNFKTIFEFQKKQMYLAGWTGVVFRFLLAAFAVLGGWLTQYFFSK